MNISSSRPKSVNTLPSSSAPAAPLTREQRLAALPNLGDIVQAPERRVDGWLAPVWTPKPQTLSLKALLPLKRKSTGQDSLMKCFNDRLLQRLDLSQFSWDKVMDRGHCTAFSSLWLHSKALGSEQTFHTRIDRFIDGTASEGDRDKLINALRWLKYGELTREMLGGNAISPLDVAVGVRRTVSHVACYDAPHFAAWLFAHVPAGHMAFLAANLHACAVYHTRDDGFAMYDPNELGEMTATNAQELAPLLARAFWLKKETLTVSNIYRLDDDMAVTQTVHALPYNAQTQPWPDNVPYSRGNWHLAMAFDNSDAIAAMVPKIPKSELQNAMAECIDSKHRGALHALNERMRSEAVPASHECVARAINSWCDAALHLVLPGNLDALVRGTSLSLLATAAGAGRLDLVQQIIGAGARIDGKSGTVTPLTEAARKGNAVVVQHLLGLGASPQGHGRGKATPLMAAVDSNDAATVKTLLQAGADTTYRAGGLRARDLVRGHGTAELLDVDMKTFNLKRFLAVQLKYAQLRGDKNDIHKYKPANRIANPSWIRRQFQARKSIT